MIEQKNCNFPKNLLISSKAQVGYNVAPPLGLYQLRHYVAERGVDCALLDRELEEIDDALAQTETGTYDIIGFSVAHDKMADDLNMIWDFRHAAERAGKPYLIIGGGQEATLNHEQWLRNGIDVVFLGFAEEALLEFNRRVAQRGSLDGIDLAELTEGMAGIAFLNPEGKVVYRPAPSLGMEAFRRLFHQQILGLELPYDRYWNLLRRASASTRMGASRFIIENVRLYTTSHCPRRCGFCNSQSFLPRSQGGELPIVMLSAQEIAELVLSFHNRFGARGVLFSDDDFPVGSKAGLDRLAEFSRIVVELKAQGKLPADMQFACQARVMDFVMRGGGNSAAPRTANHAVLEWMAKAGFNSIGLGVETFSDRALKLPSVNKIGVTVADCRMIIEALLSHGLVPQINLILGIPEYEPEELVESIRMGAHYLKAGCDIAVTPYLFALPGAPIYNTNLYKTRSTPWTNPENGIATEIADYFEPRHPAILRAIEGFQAAAQAERERIVQEQNWQGKIIPKRVVSLTSLLAVAKLLEAQDLVDELSGLLEWLLTKELTA